MNSLISVAIPVYNVEKYIKRCLSSVLSQTYTNLEIIVVNDCTPDNSMEIVASMAKEDPRIKVVNHDHNMGLMWARRTGYMNATGDYVFFLDSDDALPENAMELLLNKAINSEADIVAGVLSYISIDGHVDNKSFPCSLKYGNDRLSVLKSTLLWEMTHTLCGKLFKRSLFEGKNYKTLEHYTNGEDGLLYYQILDNVSKVECINAPVYLYYLNGQSSSQVRYSDKAMKSIMYLYESRYNIAMNYPELRKELYYATTKDLCIMSGMGYPASLINRYLSETTIPVRLNAFTIVKYLPVNMAVKGLIQVFILSKIRNKE